MICARCQCVVPDGYLACPGCVYDKSRSAMRRYQYHPLLALEAGRGRFRTRQFQGAVHLEMFGCAMTFCEISVEAGRKGDVPWSKISAPGMCAKCAAAAQELAQAARIDAQQGQQAGQP